MKWKDPMVDEPEIGSEVIIKTVYGNTRIVKYDAWDSTHKLSMQHLGFHKDGDSHYQLKSIEKWSYINEDIEHRFEDKPILMARSFVIGLLVGIVLILLIMS